MGKGVAQPNLSLGQIRDLDIPLPPLALQQSFAEKIQSIEKQKETIRASIADTQKLLDYTMDKYFG
jgi:type I restriction enzyme S subunit